MGFFSLHETCSCCGGDTGFNKYKCKGGYICPECLKKSKKLNIQFIPFTMTGESLKNKFKEIEENLKDFNETSSICNSFSIDDINKKVCIKSSNGIKIIKFNNLLSVELLEDENIKISSGGLGRAVAGGVLFGGAGAIVGGVTGRKKTKSIVKSLKVKITIKDKINPVLYIVLSNSELKTSSLLYKGLLETAQKIIGALECIIDENNIKNSGSNNLSKADELMKLKNLLDLGILTQEEFNNEKFKILNK